MLSFDKLWLDFLNHSCNVIVFLIPHLRLDMQLRAAFLALSLGPLLLRSFDRFSSKERPYGHVILRLYWDLVRELTIRNRGLSIFLRYGLHRISERSA